MINNNIATNKLDLTAAARHEATNLAESSGGCILERSFTQSSNPSEICPDPLANLV